MQNCKMIRFFRRKPIQVCKYFSNVKGENWLKYFPKNVNISESEAQFICLKHPVIKKIDEARLDCLVNTLYDMGFSEETLLEQPSLFGIMPITLKNRYKVLEECGFKTITPEHLCSYLSLVKQKTIGELKENGEIPSSVNVENKLASYLIQWPTALTTLISEDVNNLTLFNMRFKIIQRFLELQLDLTESEFRRGLETYPTIKHRPLQVLNETLEILLSQVQLPKYKIKSNLYLLHADPKNLKDIIFKLRSIGGIDMKEIIRLRPKLAIKNYSMMVEIKKILNDYKIGNEAQKRCFDIYTLAPSTVRERLEKAKSTPEFNTFYNHPRFLKMIHYNNTVLKRLGKLNENNKKCISLNVLSGSSAHYDSFEKAPGDRLGKGKDLLFCVSQSLHNKYSMNEIRKKIKRHPFWINVPLVQVKYVCNQLLKDYSYNDIYENCPILLYPWNKIKDTLKVFNKQQRQRDASFATENFNLNMINNSQKLSLVLYLLEKRHYFTGNGVWTEEKHKTCHSSLEEAITSEEPKN